MEWLPTDRADVLKEALPPESVTPPGVRSVAPSLKSTVPVGVPPPGEVAVTVAVKVKFCPKTDGLADELTTVCVTDCTVCVKTAEAMPVKLVSPEYCTVIEWLPAVR